MENYSIERLNKQNIDDLYVLFRKNGKEINKPYFHKKFSTLYTNVEYIGYFAYYVENGLKEVAAFYGVFPTIISINNKQILCAQSGDTITDKKHQKKGLFITLAQKTYELAKENGIEFIFGFPNSNSAPGFYNKLNWTQGKRYFLYEKHTNNFSLYNISYKLKIPFLYNSYLSLILKKHSCINLEKAYTSNISFNIKYLQYKQYESSYFIKVDKFCFWIKLDDGVIIGDVFYNDIIEINELSEAMSKLMKILSVKKLKWNLQENSSLYQLFKTHNLKMNESTINLGFLILKESNSDLYNTVFAYSDIDTF